MSVGEVVQGDCDAIDRIVNCGADVVVVQDDQFEKAVEILKRARDTPWPNAPADCPSASCSALEGLEGQFVSWWHKAVQEESDAKERGESEVADTYKTYAAAYSTCAARVAEVRREIQKPNAQALATPRTDD